MSWNPFSWFKKKEEELEYPRDFAVVMLTDVAKNKNISDDFNKKIFRFKNGKIYKIYDFTEDNVKNVKEILEIPLIEESIKTEYEFGEGVEYGQIKT